jgi:hypothetical protein
VVDRASLVGVSYRQTKRFWKRYREEGAKGLEHCGAGRASQAGEISAAGAAVGAGEGRGRRVKAIWADATFSLQPCLNSFESAEDAVRTQSAVPFLPMKTGRASFASARPV